jgi:tryptophan synthase alpha chain
MSRLGPCFEERRKAGQPALIAFVTAGDPSLERSLEVVLALERGGADVIELGVPFSDPVADGPVIQRASERALAGGTTLPKVLELVRQIRQHSQVPIVLFSYLNPLHRYGLETLATDAKQAGVDGVLVTDLPPEEAEAWLAAARPRGLDTIFLAAPTSPEPRLRRIAEASRGFVYAISRTGVTGERAALSGEAGPLVERLKALSDAPVALGFGISTPEQVADAGQVADGIVVGSALVHFLEEHPEGDVEAQARWLKSKL